MIATLAFIALTFAAGLGFVALISQYEQWEERRRERRNIRRVSDYLNHRPW